MDDPEYARMKKWELEDNELDENEEESALGLQENADRRFVDELNADSDDELKAGSEDDADPGMLRLSDSEDDLEAPLDDNMKPRSEEEVQKRLKERRKEARAKRLDFKKFFMPKLSSLRKAAGLNPPEKKEKVEVAKRFDKEAGEAPVNKGLVADLKDSAKEVLAYFTGEELYEHKPLEFSDIPDIFSSMWYTQKRRFLINVVGYYNLNLTGFKKYYTPASKTLLMACRSKYVKPFYIADLLEEGADPNIAEKGTDSRPLHYLVRRCNLKGVKFLVEAGADILAYDAQHRNALLCACDTPRTGDQLRIIRYLLSRPEHKGGKNLEHRDTSGNTAAINAVFKGNVWILRTLLLAGARVTEDDPSMGYESAHHVALWVYAAGLLSDIDQLPPVALNTPEAMSCFWHAFSPKGHYYWAPALLFQHQYKYSNELCLRMCQNAKKREDLVEFAPKLRRAVLLMNDEKAVTRKSKRETKEIDRIRKEKHDKKLISRKLDHEVKQVAEWNRQRLMFAARIDGEFKKGKFGSSVAACYFWSVMSTQAYGRGGFHAQVAWCLSSLIIVLQFLLALAI